jgi:hypothetical protein
MQYYLLQLTVQDIRLRYTRIQHVYTHCINYDPILHESEIRICSHETPCECKKAYLGLEF